MEIISRDKCTLFSLSVVIEVMRLARQFKKKAKYEQRLFVSLFLVSLSLVSLFIVLQVQCTVVVVVVLVSLSLVVLVSLSLVVSLVLQHDASDLR